VTPAPSTQIIWMDNLNCPTWVNDLPYRGRTTETHVEQCQHNNYSHWQWGTITGTCITQGHTNDIGVGCDGNASSTG